MAEAIEIEAEQIEALPEAVRSLFAEKDGKFVFEREDVTGLKSALQKERENRAKLEGDLKRFKGVDPDKYAELAKREQESREKQLIEAGEVEKLVTERITRAQTEWERERTTLAERLANQDKQLDQLLIDNAVAQLAESPDSHVRVKKGALEEVMMHARGVFKRLDGQVQPIGQDGRPLYGKDPSKPMTIAEWLGDLAGRKPYLFEESSGAGTTNSKQSGGGTLLTKPISKMTQSEKDQVKAELGWEGYQARLLKERRDRAAA